MAWLSNLPALTRQLSMKWDLSQLMPVDNMTYNYVAKALQHGNQPVVLKISCDSKSLDSESAALRYFDGHGVIRLIAEDKPACAILVQQAIPGTTLKSLYPGQSEFVMDQYAIVMKALSVIPSPHPGHFDNIAYWLHAIDRIPAARMPISLLEKAIQLKNELLSSMNEQYVLHGDLHHDNILSHANTWIAIDPKGIIGEPEFEAAAFDFIHANEIRDEDSVRGLFVTRSSLLAQKTGLSPLRLRQWVFIRLILSAAWSIEDNGDPAWALKLAGMLTSLV